MVLVRHRGRGRRLRRGVPVGRRHRCDKEKGGRTDRIPRGFHRFLCLGLLGLEARGNLMIRYYRGEI